MTRRICSMAATLAMAALLSCGDRPLLYEYQPVSTREWSATDTLRFRLPPSPRKSSYALSVGLRATDLIPCRDIWLVLESRTATRRQRDTLHIYLASDRARWHTRGSILHETEQQATVLNLDSAAGAELLVYHIMSRQALPGLTEVGVKAMPLAH